MIRHIYILAALALLPCAGLAQSAGVPATEAETWLPTLQVETPQQGFDLAVSMARRAVKTTQPDIEVLKAGRPVYSVDPSSLIDVSSVTADWFATIAAANDYWRK